MPMVVTPSWDDLKKPVQVYDAVSGPKTWEARFTITDLGNDALALITRAIDCRVFTALSIHVRNANLEALQAFKIITGMDIDINGDITGNLTAESDLVNTALCRTNVSDPTAMVKDSEMDLAVDLTPLPPWIQLKAQAAAETTNLEVLIRGTYR